MLNIVLFGPPGSGKGTQSERLTEKFNLIHLSTGEIFRANLTNNTELGKTAKTFMDKGQLVPDDVTIEMLKEEVLKYNSPSGFIFDGFPRTTNQAIALDELLNSLNTRIALMLALEVDEEELKKRLLARASQSGRADDSDPTIIENRIAVYNKETAPVKIHYKNQNKLTAIQGIGSIDEITQRIFSALESTQA